MGNVKSLIEADELFFDSAIVSQGYAPFMRDYYIVVDRPAQVRDASKSYIEGRYRYRFTHCPEVSIQSRVTDDAWQHSWEDIFTDYQAWETAGAPSGFVWGVCWADAYPGLSYVNDSPLAASWTRRLGREMHEVCVESNAFVVRLVCHDLRVNKIAQGDPVTRELTPLDPEQCL